MTKRLIVNADDFGYTVGVNRGIIHAHRCGILTSTTILANAPAYDDAVKCSRENPDLGVGVHINLVEGPPLSHPEGVPSLLRQDGRFCSKFALVARHLAGRLRLDELRREIAAQIDRVIDSGLRPTHLDSHQHIHAYPPFFDVFVSVAESRGIGAIRVPLERPSLTELLSYPLAAPRLAAVSTMSRLSRRRLRCSGVHTADAFRGVLRTGSVTTPWLLSMLRTLRPGVTELMTHPGHCDDDLNVAPTRLTTAREIELRAVTDSEVIQYVRTAGIELVHYGDRCWSHFSQGVA